jgi:hypothetical protein
LWVVEGSSWLFYLDTRVIYDRDTGWVVSYTEMSAMGDEEGGHHGVQVWADDKDLWERSSQNKPSQSVSQPVLGSTCLALIVLATVINPVISFQIIS